MIATDDGKYIGEKSLASFWVAPAFAAARPQVACRAEVDAVVFCVVVPRVQGSPTGCANGDFDALEGWLHKGSPSGSLENFAVSRPLQFLRKMYGTSARSKNEEEKEKYSTVDVFVYLTS